MNAWPSTPPKPESTRAGDDAGKRARPQQLRSAEAAAAIRRLEPHVRQPLVGVELDVGRRVADVVAGARDVVALGRSPSRRSLRRRAAAPARRARRPDRARTCQNDASAGSMISRRSRSSASSAAARARIRFSRRSATSASACTRSSGGAWPSRDADARSPAPAARASSQRALLHGDVGAQRLERPVGLLHGRDGLHDRLAEAAAPSSPGCASR